jgi:hypothetical protein
MGARTQCRPGVCGGLNKGEVTKEEITTTVPIGITGLVGGPSTDFIVGRFFESVTNYAVDRVMKQDASGNQLAAGKWITDPDLKKIISQTRFNSGNCSLVH